MNGIWTCKERHLYSMVHGELWWYLEDEPHRNLHFLNILCEGDGHWAPSAQVNLVTPWEYF